MIDKAPTKKRIIVLVIVLVSVLCSWVCFYYFTSFGKAEKARRLMDDGKYLQAKEIFETVDSNRYYLEIEKCENLHYEKLVNQKKYEDARAFLTTVIGASTTCDRCRECDYQIAEKKFNEGKYAEVIDTYKSLGKYKESKNRYRECRYQLALKKFENGELEEAQREFTDLINYKDTDALAKEAKSLIIYNKALKCIEDKDYVTAVEKFEEIKGFKDSKKYLKKYKKKAVKQLYKKEKYSACADFGKKYFIYTKYYYESCYEYGMHLYRQGSGKKALSYLKDAEKTHPEVAGIVAEIELDQKYKAGVEAAQSGNLEKAIQIFSETSGYKDSASWKSRCNTALRYVGVFECYSYKIYQENGTVSDLPTEGGYGNPSYLRVSASIDKNMNITYYGNGVRIEQGSTVGYYHKYGEGTDNSTVDIANKKMTTQFLHSNGTNDALYVYLFR